MSLSEKVFKEPLTSIQAYMGGKGRPNLSDKEIHKLTSNENPFGYSPLVKEAIANAIHSLNEYPAQTDHALREALCDFYKDDLSIDQFITANGGVAIIAMIVDAFLDEQTSCIVSNPCFLPYIQFSKKVGARVIDIPLQAEDYKLDVDGILDAIDGSTRVLWLCSPNNPTGTHIHRSDMDRLIVNVPNHVVVVYDEVYFQYAEAPSFVRGLDYVKQGHNVIAINSFSKAYGLAGLRVGYAYTTLQIANYINRAKRPFMLNSVSMIAAEQSLQDTAFIHMTIEQTIKNKKELYVGLDALSIRYTRTEANFVLINPEMPTKEFESKMALLGVMVRPADAFGAPGRVRVTIGTSANNQAFINASKSVLGR